jgi:4-hydroxythreonine-4-phosphate dehydrogenase
MAMMLEWLRAFKACEMTLPPGDEHTEGSYANRAVALQTPEGKLREWVEDRYSHVPLREVSGLLTAGKVADAIRMITEALRAAGKASPRVAVCGLNPHNGDNGNYGDEEGRIIEPGVKLAASRGYAADGPFSADTAFVRAIRKDGQGYDGVVTMFHDQGQIAMKLMGFERGVTVQGGLPIPITTPAHGTAYDIAGKGVANPQAMKNAFDIACRMGASRKACAPA